MDDTITDTLSRALDFGSARLQAITNNIANVNTPGYKRRDVSFDSLLDAAQDPNGTAMESAQPNDPRYIPLDIASNPSPVIVAEGGGSMRADGNNVDVDTEGAKLAAAQLYYSTVDQMMAAHFTGLKDTIKSQ